MKKVLLFLSIVGPLVPMQTHAQLFLEGYFGFNHAGVGVEPGGELYPQDNGSSLGSLSEGLNQLYFRPSGGIDAGYFLNENIGFSIGAGLMSYGQRWEYAPVASDVRFDQQRKRLTYLSLPFSLVGKVEKWQFAGSFSGNYLTAAREMCYKGGEKVASFGCMDWHNRFMPGVGLDVTRYVTSNPEVGVGIYYRMLLGNIENLSRQGLARRSGHLPWATIYTLDRPSQPAYLIGLRATMKFTATGTTPNARW